MTGIQFQICYILCKKYCTLLFQLSVSQLGVIRLCPQKLLHDINRNLTKSKMQCTKSIAHSIRKYSIHTFGKYRSSKYA